jgi:hypothetical protein
MFERPKRGVGCARGAPEAIVIQIATKVDAAVFCNRISFDARSEETRTPRENRDFVPAIRRVRKSNQFRFRRPIRVDRRLIACVEISNVDFSR